MTKSPQQIAAEALAAQGVRGPSMPLHAHDENLPIATRTARQRLAEQIKLEQLALQAILAGPGGSVPDDVAAGLAARAAEQWDRAGLPNTPDRPVAPEGVEPWEPPSTETVEAPEYSGPSLAEIDRELREIEQSGEVTAASISRVRQLQQQRNLAYQGASAEERRAATFADQRRREDGRR